MCACVCTSMCACMRACTVDAHSHVLLFAEDEKEQDFGKLVTEHASALGVNVPVQKLLKVLLRQRVMLVLTRQSFFKDISVDYL